MHHTQQVENGGTLGLVDKRDVGNSGDFELHYETGDKESDQIEWGDWEVHGDDHWVRSSYPFVQLRVHDGSDESQGGGLIVNLPDRTLKGAWSGNARGLEKHAGIKALPIVLNGMTRVHVRKQWVERHLPPEVEIVRDRLGFFVINKA